jgi:hypothetical protein
VVQAKDPSPTHDERVVNLFSNRQAWRPSSILLWGAFALWIAVYLSDVVPTIGKQLPYYRFAISATSKEIRARHVAIGASSTAFSAMLEECDRLIPTGAKVQMILPSANRTRREYLRDKARYLLYPKNNGNNEIRRPFILTFEVPDFEVPAGYRMIKSYGAGNALYFSGGLRMRSVR